MTINWGKPQRKLNNRKNGQNTNALSPSTPGLSSSNYEHSFPANPVKTPTSWELPSWLSWQLLVATMVLLSAGMGYFATSYLLKLPKTANCAAMFLPMASAANRMYCAQLQAETKTVDGLLKAINLIEVLPKDHSLRPEINRFVEEWAVEILNLADEEFQQGNLEKAVAVARKIPKNSQASKVVEKRVARWEKTWQEGEKTYDEVEKQLRQSNWNQAFRVAVQLTNINNKYWATVKYQETVDKIQGAREESSKLDDAYAKLRKGNIDNLLAAIEASQKIETESYVYKEAQDLIEDAKNKLLKIAQNYIEDKNWKNLEQLSTRIPNNLGWENNIQDWTILANAGIEAQRGTTEGLESAIAYIQKLDPKSSVYNEGQNLIARWQIEIEDVIRLSKGRNLAQSNTIENLNAAINEVNLIPRNNPRYQEARQEINNWNAQIQIIEDSPYLERAKQLSIGGDTDSWRAAIAQASVIGSNRSLYRQAQREIRKWRSNIETEEDRPILDRALVLANDNDFAAAVETAKQISQGRALSFEAGKKIRIWQREIKAKDALQQANQVANFQTPESLARAIKLAQQVPASTKVRPQSLENIDQWSNRLLEISQQRSPYSLEEAIKIAQMIPTGTSAYQSAQAQIVTWQNMLQQANPAPSESSDIRQLQFFSPPSR